MKAFWYSLPPGTKFLATLYLLGFLAIFLLRSATGIDLSTAIAVDGSALSGFQVWRLFTYCLVAGSPLDAVFGTLFILFLGPGVERYWSPTRFLTHFLASGVASGIVFAWILRNSPAGILTNAGALLGVLVPWFVLNRFQRWYLSLTSTDLPCSAATGIYAVCIVAPFALTCGWRLTPAVLASVPVSWLILRSQDMLSTRRTHAATGPSRASRIEL